MFLPDLQFTDTQSEVELSYVFETSSKVRTYSSTSLGLDGMYQGVAFGMSQSYRDAKSRFKTER